MPEKVASVWFSALALWKLEVEIPEGAQSPSHIAQYAATLGDSNTSTSIARTLRVSQKLRYTCHVFSNWRLSKQAQFWRTLQQILTTVKWKSQRNKFCDCLSHVHLHVAYWPCPPKLTMTYLVHFAGFLTHLVVSKVRDDVDRQIFWQKLHLLGKTSLYCRWREACEWSG